jgi:hypothetical protein
VRNAVRELASDVPAPWEPERWVGGEFGGLAGAKRCRRFDTGRRTVNSFDAT